MATKLNCECLRKAADNEPIFVLRAQDVLAPVVVETWANVAARNIGNDHPKVLEARKLADEMRAWPTRKIPD